MNFPFVRFFFSVLMPVLWTRCNSDSQPGEPFKDHGATFLSMGLGESVAFAFSEGLFFSCWECPSCRQEALTNLFLCKVCFNWRAGAFVATSSALTFRKVLATSDRKL